MNGFYNTSKSALMTHFRHTTKANKIDCQKVYNYPKVK